MNHDGGGPPTSYLSAIHWMIAELRRWMEKYPNEVEFSISEKPGVLMIGEVRDMMSEGFITSNERGTEFLNHMNEECKRQFGNYPTSLMLLVTMGIVFSKGEK